MATTMPSFPDAASAGVRDGISLQPYYGDLTITQDGADISGLEVHGRVTILANNVHFHDNKVVDTGDDMDIYIPDGHTGAVIDHNDISGAVNGISGTGTFQFNDISGVDNGINVYGPSLIENNFIHALGATPDGHYDGIEINGGGGTTIHHNTIINDSDQTSAIMIDNYFGGGSNIVVDDNFMAGGGYTFYLDNRFQPDDPITNVQVTNNYIGQGYWGYYAVWDSNAHFSGNVELGTTWTPPSSGVTDNPAPTPEPTPPPDPGPTPDPAPTPDPVEQIPPGYTAVNGTDGSDKMHGTDGADWIHGGAGNDVINGWAGEDIIFGDAGNDRFVFTNLTSGDGDTIMDFHHGEDRIDLRQIDANLFRRGDQAFKFAGYHTPWNENGKVWLTEDDSHARTDVHVQASGHEMVVHLQGLHLGLTASDFLL